MFCFVYTNLVGGWWGLVWDTSSCWLLIKNDFNSLASLLSKASALPLVRVLMFKNEPVTEPISRLLNYPCLNIYSARFQPVGPSSPLTLDRLSELPSLQLPWKEHFKYYNINRYIQETGCLKKVTFVGNWDLTWNLDTWHVQSCVWVIIVSHSFIHSFRACCVPGRE